jgi:hypothetical protein
MRQILSQTGNPGSEYGKEARLFIYTVDTGSKKIF